MEFDFEPGEVDQSAPLIYLWTLHYADGTSERYVGKSKHGAKRPLQDYARNIRRMQAGLPYRAPNPDGWRRVHLAMRRCIDEGGTLVLTLIENAPLEALNAAERGHIASLAPELNG